MCSSDLKDWNKVVKYIREHKKITNVLISGGDPLMLHAGRIAYILQKLSGIKHLKFIRIGTRIPVVFPSRITKNNELINILKKYSSKDKRVYITTQFNHPKEITPDSIEADRKSVV